MRTKDFDKADKEKGIVEEAQRQEAKEMKEQGKQFVSRFGFKSVGISSSTNALSS